MSTDISDTVEENRTPQVGGNGDLLDHNGEQIDLKSSNGDGSLVSVDEDSVADDRELRDKCGDELVDELDEEIVACGKFAEAVVAFTFGFVFLPFSEKVRSG